MQGWDQPGFSKRSPCFVGIARGQVPKSGHLTPSVYQAPPWGWRCCQSSLGACSASGTDFFESWLTRNLQAQARRRREQTGPSATAIKNGLLDCLTVVTLQRHQTRSARCDGGVVTTYSSNWGRSDH